MARETILVAQGATPSTASGEPLMSDATRWRDLVFLSGRAAVDPATGRPLVEDFDGQCQIVLRDALRVLAEAGSGPEHVLRVNCWLADRADFPAWNAHWSAAFAPPRPARTTVLADLPLEGLLIEIELTAGIPA